MAESLALSPYVPVHAYLSNKETAPRFRSCLDRCRTHERWLDSSLSLMEQAVAEGELVQLRFKYLAFGELGGRGDAVRINQIYEQAKWAILSEEIEATEQELINFAALQVRLLVGGSIWLDCLTFARKKSKGLGR